MIAMVIMRRYNISVLGIAETRWTQTGPFRLATGELILYSGHTHDGAGMGFTLSKQAEKALVQMLAQNPPDLLAKYYQQCYPVGENRLTTRQRTD